jgi:hypothetical protein
MVSLASLWLPILLSAVAVFITSSLVHMVLRYHNTDFKRLPDEDGVMRALAPFNLAPAQYIFPAPEGPASMKDPAFIEKRTRGPAGFLNVFPKAMPGMGGPLGKWFVFSLVVTLFAAYLASRALEPGAHGADVFRFTMTTAFLAYGMSDVSNSIWYGVAWSTTLKRLFDAALYGAVTGAVFWCLWPG